MIYIKRISTNHDYHQITVMNSMDFVHPWASPRLGAGVGRYPPGGQPAAGGPVRGRCEGFYGHVRVLVNVGDSSFRGSMTMIYYDDQLSISSYIIVPMNQVLKPLILRNIPTFQHIPTCLLTWWCRQIPYGQQPGEGPGLLHTNSEVPRGTTMGMVSHQPIDP